METEIETGDSVNEKGRTGNRQLIDISLKEVNCIVAVVVSFSLLLLSPMSTWASIESMAFECGTHSDSDIKAENNPVGLSVHYEFSINFNFIDKKICIRLSFGYQPRILYASGLCNTSSFAKI